MGDAAVELAEMMGRRKTGWENKQLLSEHGKEQQPLWA